MYSGLAANGKPRRPQAVAEGDSNEQKRSHGPVTGEADAGPGRGPAVIDKISRRYGQIEAEEAVRLFELEGVLERMSRVSAETRYD